MAWILGAALAVLALDRLALWAESRGWLYWRRRKASTGSLGSALLEVQQMVEPGQRYVAEAREERPAEADEQGDPPAPDESDRRAPTAKLP